MRRYKKVICIREGAGYIKGDEYACVGWKDGIHLVYANNNGEPEEINLHHFGGVLAPPKMYGLSTCPLFVEKKTLNDVCKMHIEKEVSEYERNWNR